MSTGKEEMRHFILKWVNSKIYKNFLKQKEKMKSNKLFTKDELIELCHSIMALYELSEEERSEFEFLDEVAIASMPKLELYKQFSKTLSTWYAYLNRHVIAEDYELCAMIRDIIEIEKREFYMLLKKYCVEYNLVEDFKTIAMVEFEIRKVFSI